MLIKSEHGVIDAPITKVTAENYIVEESEKHLYHCIIEVRKFNAETGERLSKPRVQKFGKKTFHNVASGLRKQGYTVTILHEPDSTPVKTMAQVQREAEEKRIADAVAKALAEQEAKHLAEIEALKAEKKAKKGKKGAETAQDGAQDPKEV